ncbi:MAG: inositol monophosphatase [Thermomicrobiales bacterium]
MPAIPTDAVIPELATIADEVILPRYQSLHDGEVEEKSPGELVTVADREAEIRIAAVLRDLRPDATIIGEEAVETNPGLLDALKTSGACWLIDPLDGTQNFVNGKRAFAVMVALVEAGETVASWVWLPLDRVAYVAERGSGAYRNGVRQHVPPPPTEIRGAVDGVFLTEEQDVALALIRGSVLTKFLNVEQRTALAGVATRFDTIGPGQYCAGVEYPLIVEGAQEFVRFQRLRPWDHAPGTLYLAEAGGCVRRWDGAPYSPGTGGTGLLATADAAMWPVIRSALGTALD